MSPVAGTADPVALYDEGLRALGSGDRLASWLHRADGAAFELPLARWAGEPCATDRLLLERCTGPTLDVGCGPGRLTAAVARRVPSALGIDVSREAVRLTRRRGAPALCRDVFGAVPGEGRWQHVLVADGNVGIGGDAVALLRRAGDLIAHGGEVLCEVGPPGALTGSAQVRLEVGLRWSAWFAWATLSRDAVDGAARAAGLVVRDSFRAGERWFVCLTRA